MKYLVTLNGKQYEIEAEEGAATLLSERAVAPAPVSPPAPEAAPRPASAGGGENVLAPMPGTVLKVNAAPGQSVKAGEAILVLEAMKMEIDIQAPRDAVVKQIRVQQGANVNTDDVLAVL